uniref:Ovule protein n=1 Tax=Heterorhabditis bacteriophora TaxID=37862 RepID=A0A1I7X679_HETBA
MNILSACCPCLRSCLECMQGPRRLHYDRFTIIIYFENEFKKALSDLSDSDSSSLRRRSRADPRRFRFFLCWF